MAAKNGDAIRAELEELGQRRAQIEADEEALMKEVTKVLSRAYGVVPVAECARLLNMHRTTVYRVYHPHAA